MNPRQKLIDLANQRTQALSRAEAAMAANRQTDYDAAMAEVDNLNKEIERVQALIREQERQIDARQPTPAEVRDMAGDRGEALRRGEAVTFTVDEVRRAVRNESVTLATGTLVQPTGAGTNIRDPLGNVVSSIVDQVYVQDLTGMGSYIEPYVITETEASAGKVTTLAGKLRSGGTDPTFGLAEIRPYEMTVTQYVDRNISRLSPANYFEKIRGMSMRAMRRKLAGFIANGDGQEVPDMYGIKTAKNKAGEVIYATENVTAVDETLLDTLIFAYGSDEALGGNARLYLTKKDLKAIGMIRNSDKQRVFRIRYDGGNPNTGTIEDGGVIVPYTILSALTSLSASTAGEQDIQTLLYGDPINYELGLFGGFTVRVDESYKAGERMLTILGDAMVGGNLIVHKGFVVATLAKSGIGG